MINASSRFEIEHEIVLFTRLSNSYLQTIELLPSLGRASELGNATTNFLGTSFEVNPMIACGSGANTFMVRVKSELSKGGIGDIEKSFIFAGFNVQQILPVPSKYDFELLINLKESYHDACVFDYAA